MNIPTAETQSLAAKDEQGPQTMRYPRDPSLDPQLVWKGKDEQDGEDLVVPALPIYIQEQISPKAIIEDLRATTAAGTPSSTSSPATSTGWRSMSGSTSTATR